MQLLGASGNSSHTRMEQSYPGTLQDVKGTDWRMVYSGQFMGPVLGTVLGCVPPFELASALALSRCSNLAVVIGTTSSHRASCASAM